MILARKISKILEFFKITFSLKINKIPEFTWFLLKNARILHNNCPKNILSRILGGHVPHPLPHSSPTPMYISCFKCKKRVSVTRIWNRLINFRTGSGYPFPDPDPATNHYFTELRRVFCLSSVLESSAVWCISLQQCSKSCLNSSKLLHLFS